MYNILVILRIIDERVLTKLTFIIEKYILFIKYKILKINTQLFYSDWKDKKIKQQYNILHNLFRIAKVVLSL